MVNIQTLKKLREETGISIALCKKALEESKGDIKKAKSLLHSSGAETVMSKVSRSTQQGAIFSYVHHNRKIASLIEVLCETDFVAKNEAFQTLGRELAMQVATSSSSNVDQFVAEPYNREPSRKISDLIQEAILKFGENIKVGRFLKWEL